ncbi:MAG: rhomboid family intramembrane serine protease [Synechococcaceae cyanobacterium SM2_3_1]|nr:rhomboid family intramembrane serine protease [Synechococcaceae cyanobacterium SM2_3_1]
MDLNQLLIWMISFSCGINLIRALAQGYQLQQALVLIPGLVLGITLGGTWLVPDIAGLVGGCFWILLLVLPSLLFRKVGELISTEHYPEADSLVHSFHWIYRLYQLRWYPHLVRALALAASKDTAAAENILCNYQQSTTVPTPWEQMVIVALYRVMGTWNPLLNWAQPLMLQPQQRHDPSLVLAYLRALGETGDLNSLLQAYDTWRGGLEQAENPTLLRLAQLFVLAFTGQMVTVEKLLKQDLNHLPDPVKQFWGATSLWAGGLPELAQTQLQSLLDTHPSLSPSLQKGIQQRLSRIAPSSDQILTPNSRQILFHLSQTLSHSEPMPVLDVNWIASRPTLALMSLNILVFGCQLWWGGESQTEALLRLGALAVPNVLAGEWWRLITANVLHSGPLHLLLNVLALLILGPFVETSLGAGRYLLLYWGAGVGSMAILTLLQVTQLSELALVVGASACIMGLLGATAAILLHLWRQTHSPVALRRLRSILLIILLQTIFDLSVPQISVMGHLSGLVIGFGLGTLLNRSRRT